MGLLAAVAIFTVLQYGNVTEPVDDYFSDEERDHLELVFVLQYIGRDYQNAVADGVVINEFEYREMITFCQHLIELYGTFEQSRSNDPILFQIQELRQMVYEKAERHAIRDLTKTLIRDVARKMRIATVPAETPDIEKGRIFYEAGGCGVCHGPTGAGDGYAAEGLEPEPACFQEQSRMLEATPFQFFNAIKLGVNGTAMPSHEEAFSRQEIWNVAFYLMTLRDGFDPHLTGLRPDVTLEDLATKSDLDLLQEIRIRQQPIEGSRATQEAAIAAAIDFLRSHPDVLK